MSLPSTLPRQRHATRRSLASFEKRVPLNNFAFVMEFLGAHYLCNTIRNAIRSPPERSFCFRKREVYFREADVTHARSISSMPPRQQHATRHSLASSGKRATRTVRILNGACGISARRVYFRNQRVHFIRDFVRSATLQAARDSALILFDLSPFSYVISFTKSQRRTNAKRQIPKLYPARKGLLLLE